MSNKIVLFDIDYTLFDTDAFKKSKHRNHSLYAEVHDVLEKLSKIVYLGVFSEGVHEFQKTKLEKTHIEHFFSDELTHIVDKKDITLRNVLEKYKNFKIILVDDKLTILYKARLFLPSAFVIWVKRGKYAKNQKEIDNFEPNAIVSDLRDIVQIVKNS